MILPAGAATAVGLDRIVQFGDHSYPFTVCAGQDAWNGLSARLADLSADRFVLVADAGLPAGVRERVLKAMRGLAPVTVCDILPGERNKTPEAVTRILRAAFNAGITKKSVFVALGGGQVGNMAGHAAGEAFRGGACRLFHVPTTLLALSDSAASRKQGDNLLLDDGTLLKNVVGARVTPAGVFGIIDVLRTCSAEQIKAGLCEGAKNLTAILPGRAAEFEELFRPDARYTDEFLVRFTDMCLQAKQAVMEHDPDEQAEAVILEWGHELGHALEALDEVPHGLAIAIGGQASARVARMLGFPGAGRTLEMHARLLKQIGVPAGVPRFHPDETWLRQFLRDNKRGIRKIADDDIEIVLLDEPGVPHCTGRLPLTQVPARLLLRAVREMEQAA